MKKNMLFIFSLSLVFLTGCTTPPSDSSSNTSTSDENGSSEGSLGQESNTNEIEEGGIANEEAILDETVEDMTGQTVVIDFNHPLAGETLTFDITVDSIEGGDTVTTGTTVGVYYQGTLQDGTVFDSNLPAEDGTQSGDVLEFTLGEGQLIEGFESAVIGAQVGDEITTTIAPEDAYGVVLEENIISVDASQLTASGIEPATGLVVQLSTEQGPAQGTIIRIEE